MGIAGRIVAIDPDDDLQLKTSMEHTIAIRDQTGVRGKPFVFEDCHPQPAIKAAAEV